MNQITPQPPTQHIDPQFDMSALLSTLWRWRWLVLLIAILPPAYAVKSKPKEIIAFQAFSTLQVNTSTVNPDTGQFDTTGSWDKALIQKTRRILATEKAWRLIGQRMNPPQTQLAGIRGSVTTAVDEDGGFLVVQSIASTAEKAKDLNAAAVSALQSIRKAEVLDGINVALAAATARRKAATTADRYAADGRYFALKALKQTATSRIQIISPAFEASRVVSPAGRSLPIAFIMGLLFGAIAALFAEQLDKRVRTVDELQRVAPMPLLSVIPALAFEGKDDRDGYVRQSVELLRASIWTYKQDNKLDLLTLVSARQGEGKTTVAVALAEALARAGKRIILVDADMRHPQVPARLGLRNGLGLREVLDGGEDANELLETIDLEVAEGLPDRGGWLKVLKAGEPTRSAAEVLVSADFPKLLKGFAEECDLVILDTPAALATSDILPVLRHADGVLLVARLRFARQVALKRLIDVVIRSKGNFIGSVATGDSGNSKYQRYSYSAYEERSLLDRFKRLLP